MGSDSLHAAHCSTTSLLGPAGSGRRKLSTASKVSQAPQPNTAQLGNTRAGQELSCRQLAHALSLVCRLLHADLGAAEDRRYLSRPRTPFPSLKQGIPWAAFLALPWWQSSPLQSLLMQEPASCLAPASQRGSLPASAASESHFSC